MQCQRCSFQSFVIVPTIQFRDIQFQVTLLRILMFFPLKNSFQKPKNVGMITIFDFTVKF
ncbi:hypothetical protein LEP1GSC082_0758 [Leptospira kirschneri str. H2]|uniref:Uncharacterized protein n=1 Tax=Leptospira kirschneri str. H1 TaxID=1049966 RepID=A0A0E2BFL1_9LEPT|nr:hypothetical protein LEP1GSC081_4183 [Leptospira kirschneri str. H1]EKO60881.1 hypothetical protein LEP1GSC082_0758 [Leptospira kirschneri str. H2]